MPKKFPVSSGVYCARNLVNGKVYVGSSTKSIEMRFYSHKVTLNRGVHFCKSLQSDWKEFGEESFEFITLEICLTRNCLKCETKWIKKLKACNPEFGYNQSPIGGSTKGIKISDTTKHSIAAKKRYEDHPEILEKLWKLNTGSKHSEEHKRKIGEKLKGKKVSQKTREKLRELGMVSNLSEETRRKRSEAAKRQWERYRAEKEKLRAKIK